MRYHRTPDGKQTEVQQVSRISGKISEMILPLTVAVFEVLLENWDNGALIQDAFSTLNDDQQEFIMSGITPSEWKAVFSGKED